jgi:hypothetical protein
MIEVAQGDGWAGIEAAEKSCSDDAEATEKAGKVVGETRDAGTSVMAEGVMIRREEVLTFFVNVVSSSISLRLPLSRSTGGGNIAANIAA